MYNLSDLLCYFVILPDTLDLVMYYLVAKTIRLRTEKREVETPFALLNEVENLFALLSKFKKYLLCLVKWKLYLHYLVK